MSTLTQASQQWATRPDDERFCSLTELQSYVNLQRERSRGKVVSSRSIQAVPTSDNKGIVINGAFDEAVPTNWSFGQLSSLAGAPAGYLRKLPSPIAADCINYGLYKRDIEDVGVLLHENGEHSARAFTGPNYGRVWNKGIVDQLVDRFGDGITGDFKVPGEFGKDVVVTKSNTTLYASDRDLFVFLADEKNRIELPNRRDGKTGTLARGFFVTNSEVGGGVLGISTFVFDYACSNRIVWGAQQVSELRIRHTSSAPDRFIEEVTPAIEQYAQSSATGIVQAIEDARAKRLDNVDDFLAKRFGKKFGDELRVRHFQEENRPIENLWDVATAVTAKARDIKWQDERVSLERQAGAVLDLAA